MNQLSVMKLFKGFIGEKTDRIREDALKYGLLIPQSATDDVCADAIRLYGKDAKAWNKTFHKSWNKVANAPIEELVLEQIIHYMTTYGFEDLGVFSHESVYLPHEKLEIPELKEDIELVSIHAYTEEEVSEKLMALLTSGIALSKDTISCITDLTDLIDISRYEEIRNREARIALCDAFSIAPEDPDEFLRYLIYKATGSTLKIQDQFTIDSLKAFSRKELLLLIQRYLKKDEDNAMKKLASVFLRNKKLFLAMKTPLHRLFNGSADIYWQVKNIFDNEKEEATQLNHLINRLAKLAKHYHRPMKVNKLDRLTAASTEISDEELLKGLESITVFREIRILNGLCYALSNNSSIVYRIRNGRSYATERKVLDETGQELIRNRYELVSKHLIGRLKPLLEGKTILLPDDFLLKAPTSEKQFVGNFPCGSSFEAKKDSDVIFGIHWTNLEHEDEDDSRVDLDLHMQNTEISFGWNSAYRSEKQDIYYSGDMTDAPLPEGASELYYIGQDVDSTFLFSINKYTNNPEKIPFDTVLSRSPTGIAPKDLNQYHMIDPGSIIIKVPMEMAANESMMRLGFVYVTGDSIRMVFDSFSSGRLIVSRNDDPVFMHTFSYLAASQKSSLDLQDLLKECGAIIVNETNENNASSETKITDYDLSLNALTKETIISLFSADNA
ncbi:MAG: hypothetical protein IJL85_03170 [Erysipelotrichaceae bacterium]|nr:hypothetical protein [Erysipelotrichaceae bacterium]